MPQVAEFIGTRITAANLITGSGILRGFIASHNLGATNATLTFYDNTSAAGTILLRVYINQGNMPYRLMLSRDDALRFDTGLSVSYTNLEVNVWAVQLT